ncbi:MAG: DUF58 domain-containing protein, partial [Flavobacteriales bacterium]|nr:DUF58 domain-containing protein [Flavobacteriales bacterium]
LTCFDESIQMHLPSRGTPAHVQQVFAMLESLIEKPDKKRGTSAAAALDDIAERIHRRSLVVVFSDLFDGDAESAALFNALQHLKHQQHEVIFFHVLDTEYEEKLGFENRPYTFVDNETGEKVKLNPADLREAYTQQILHLRQSISIKCAQFGIDYTAIDIKDSFEKVLLAWLIKRKQMV